MSWRFRLLLLVLGAALAPPRGQTPDDPALRAAVERFYAAQVAEDVDAYLGLWSANAQRPRPEVLKVVFDSGDDLFSDIAIQKVTPSGDRVRVRVAATRDRMEPGRTPEAPAVQRQSRMLVNLTYRREGGEWKLVREGPLAEDLATALLEAETDEEREALLEAEADVLTAGPFGEGLVQALARRAGQAAQEGRYAQAEAGYLRMLEIARRTGHGRFEAEAQQNLGNARYFGRDFAGALAAYEERLRIDRARGDEEGTAAAIAGIATVRYSLAEYSAAMSAYREALAIQERLGDEAAVATTLVSTGNILYLQGDYERAIADYARSRAISRRLGAPASEAQAWKGLGRVFMARGDYAGALEAFTRVLEEARARDNRSEQGGASLSLGEAHLRLGNVEAARDIFQESRAHFEAVKDAANAGRVWQAIALADLIAGRLAAAEDRYGRSAAECETAGDAECTAGARAGLGFAQTAQEKFAEAARSYRRAIGVFAALQRRESEARAEVGLSEALLGDGQLDAAQEAAARARRTATGRGYDDVLWRALVADARVLRKRGELAQAISAAQAAVHAVQRMMDTWQVSPGAAVSRDTTAVFATLAVLHAARGDPAAAFETAERMRTHDLRVTLAAAEREIARGMSAEEREKERALSAELVSLHAQLSREKALPKADAERLDRLEGSLREISTALGAHRDQVFARLPDLPLWRGLLTPATAADLPALIDARTVVVEFILDDRDLLAITASGRADGEVTLAAELVAVTRRAIAERIAGLLDASVLASEEGWSRAAAGFLKLLPPAVGTALSSATRAVVVPHEILWRVPIEALPLDGGYVEDRVSVVYAHSITALVRTPAATSDPAGHLLVAAGAPEIAPEVRDRISQTAPGWTLRDGGRARGELDAVVDDLRPDEFLTLAGADLTEDRLRRELLSAGFVHLAAPFRVNGASPLFSGLLLSGTPSAGDVEAADAVLDTRELMNLTLQARVAVLSDGSALTMREAADDAAVVQWAWRAAGVPAVVLARWETEAGAASALLAEFHRELRRAGRPDAALQRARFTVRRREGQGAPYFWAGWFLLGEAPAR